jgi:ectoine hydroxylase-related dioxygenase (phytanoyl-CoA dioxygenase family)
VKFLTFSLFLAFSALQATQGYLTSEDIELFHQQGYLLKKECLSHDEIDRIRESVDGMIERSLHADSEMIYVDGSRVVFHKSPDRVSISRINGVCGMCPELKETLHSDKMVHTFFELLNTSDLEHIIAQMHPKLPGDKIAFPRHQDVQFRKVFDPDWQDVLGNGSYAICIIAIDPMSQENGGLWVEPFGKKIEIEADPGDFLFMNPYVYHGSEENISPTLSRKTLLTGFCAFGANHKPYPGVDINVRYTLMQDQSIKAEPAPWSGILPTRDGNH